ncbi:MAG: methylenetetrahydrofolate reductase [NAD(P)H] [Opitutales bacterium]|nr:methylenetetrahydrofolate reductase [NAD(P)H] [Opitutales bacterium]
MNKETRNIAKKFASTQTVFSVEFFPPKTEEGARQILRTAAKLRDLKPDYVSITYGAGGSTRERTMEYGSLLRDIFDFVVMPHLTCFGHSKDEIADILKNLTDSGFSNIMALRGDPPKGETTFVPHPDGFKHASELIEFIRKNYPNLSIGCAGYPEKHPEAKSFDDDINFLKHKVDCGADFIVTQMFFENSHFFKFVEKCRAVGIDKPIIAGILPALSLSQVMRFKSMCASEIPDRLIAKLEKAGDLGAEVGLDWAQAQIDELKQNKVDGIHLYILNRAESAQKLAKACFADR